MKLDYSSWKNTQNNSSNNENNAHISFFNLKDGEDTLIRIMHEDVSKIDVVACHWIEYNGRNMMVNCPRNPQDPVDKCPCCADGTPLMYRAFIRVLEYTQDENGNIQAMPKIWNRPASFIKILVDKEADWGPLNNVVCKVRRYGSGSNTTFDVQPLPSERYPVSVYSKDTDVFNNYDPLGHAVMNMPNAMLNKGDAPTTSVKNNDAPPFEVNTQATPIPKAPVTASSFNEAPAFRSNPTTPAADTRTTTPVGDGFNRPRRFY